MKRFLLLTCGVAAFAIVVSIMADTRNRVATDEAAIVAQARAQFEATAREPTTDEVFRISYEIFRAKERGTIDMASVHALTRIAQGTGPAADAARHNLQNLRDHGYLP